MRPKTLDVRRDCFSNEPLHFGLCSGNRNAPRQIGYVRSVICFALLDDYCVFVQFFQTSLLQDTVKRAFGNLLRQMSRDGNRSEAPVYRGFDSVDDFPSFGPVSSHPVRAF